MNSPAMLKTIRIYAEFYDGAMTSAWILHAAEMSAASSARFQQCYCPWCYCPCWQRTFLRRAESIAPS